MNKMNTKKAKRYMSIMIRIVLALFALVMVQGLILLCSITITGAIRKNDIAIYKILSNQSKSKKNEIQEQLNTKRKNITNVSYELSDKIENVLSHHNMSLDELSSTPPVYDNVLNMVLNELITFTKCSPVTGVFVVLDPTSEIADEAKMSRTSIYLRDSSPGIVSGNNSNLLLEHGYVDIARQSGIAVDYLWTRDMSFCKDYSRDFYYKPIRAYLDDPTKNVSLQTYGYWSPPFQLRKDDISIIMYSMPLVLSNGTIYGVIGIELETIYISNMMKTMEIPYENGFYLMGVDIGGGLLNDTVIFSGAYGNQFLSGPSTKLVSHFLYENEQSRVSEIINPNFPNRTAIGAYNRIEMYETFSPFHHEEWALMCMGPKGSIMSGSNSIRNSIIISIISTIIPALFLSVMIMFFIAAPVQRLSNKVKNIDPEKPVRFEKVNILEIDELSGAFEILSDRVSEAAVRMFKIIELVDMPLGSFEVDHDKNRVRLSKSLFDILDLDKPGGDVYVITGAIWNNMLRTLQQEYLIQEEDGISETLYQTDSSWNTKKWFRMRMITENNRDIGVFIDVSGEIAQKQRLEYERNYDFLTKLLNRNAFMNQASELIASRPDKVAVMMFADLDDLKFVNDTYGHETGDEYIKAFSVFLIQFKELGAVVGRISGDEFVMLVGGFLSKNSAKTALDNMLAGLKELSIAVPDGSDHKLRVSIGLSYYPGDSDDIHDLVKYADYAMYEIKHSNKGGIKEFNISDYNKNSFVIRMKDILNLLIEEKMICFAFQPIVDVKTGEVFAYESLMRSLIKELKHPSDILRIARSQSKLYLMEKLTFSMIFKWISRNMDKIKGKKIFVNSIPGQIFTENDLSEMRHHFRSLSHKIVFEITENEFSSKEDTIKKVSLLRGFGAQVAIDDYGSGYSNEAALLSIEPDFLKIDRSIVEAIDRDVDKQKLVQNTIAYAAQKKIRIIAEGVETYEEMKKLIEFGVDYIQGFYLARPSHEIFDIQKKRKEELIGISRSLFHDQS